VNGGSRVEILATGVRFLRHAVRAIEPAVLELVAEATEELHLAMYLLGDDAGPLVELLERAVRRGVRVLLVVSDLARQGQEAMRRFQRLERAGSTLRIVEFRERDGGVLHAKVVVADRRRAVVGSANLTWGGLRGNHEIGVLLDGEPAWVLAALVDSLAGPAM